MQLKVLKNAGWIVGCKVVKALLTLIVTAITTRYLGVENYGLISYAAGLVAFVVPIMQLGLNFTIVHEIIERPKEEGKVVGTVMAMSAMSSLLCIVGVIAFSMIVNAGEKDTIIVCAVYSLMLCFQAFEMVHYWFQAKLMSKYSAITMLFSYVAVTVFQVLLVVFRASVYFFAISYSLDYLIIAVVLTVLFTKKSGQKLSFSFALAKQMFSVSKFYIVSNLMVTIFAQTDKVMLKLMLGNAETGIYSAAYNCAIMANFVFAAIIDSMRPDIFNAKKDSQEKFEEKMSELYSVLFYFSLIMCVAITLLSPLVIKIMCGDGYAPSVDVLRIAVWMTIFSYLGTARSIWILAENKQKYLWILNLVGAVLNVGLNFVLIPMLGALGAAITTVATQFFANVILGFIMKPIRRNNKLLLRGLNPKYVKNIFTAFKKNGGDVE
ncbi:MAG: flippase [Clostridia bacterium]|nr:flippase [Clostridia bacterium]